MYITKGVIANWDKGRPNKQKINATELFEVEVGMLVLVEKVVDLTDNE